MCRKIFFHRFIRCGIIIIRLNVSLIYKSTDLGKIFLSLFNSFEYFCTNIQLIEFVNRYLLEFFKVGHRYI